MTDIVRELRVFWTDGRPVERLAYRVGAVLLLSGLAHLGVQAVVGGPWDGPVSWRKPTTFGLSFGLTVISVAWVASLLRLPDRRRTALLGAFLVASVVEVVLVSLQAWRRVPSHFDFQSRFDTAVSVTLAVGGGVLFVVLGALFVHALASRSVLDPVLRAGIRLGLGALLAGLVVGAVMIGIGSALVRAGDPEAAYHGAGVLKLAHAVGLHGIAVLPGLAWLSGLARERPVERWTVLRVGAAGYLGVFGCAVAAGARGSLGPVTVTGLLLAGSVLLSALAMASAGLFGGRRAPGRVPAG
jgi:hypothetical protein